MSPCIHAVLLWNQFCCNSHTFAWAKFSHKSCLWLLKGLIPCQGIPGFILISDLEWGWAVHIIGQVSGSHVYLEDLGWPIWHLPAAIVLCVSCSEKKTRRHADPEVCIRGSVAGGPCVSSSDRDNVLLSPGHSLLAQSNLFRHCQVRTISVKDHPYH